MKKLFLLLTILFFAAQPIVAQSSCSRYYILKEGVSYEYTNYNKKGKEEGKIIYEMTDVTENGDSVSATMNMKMIDKKGNVYTSNYNMVCENGTVKIDFKSLMNQQMLSQLGNGDLEVEVTGTDVELPSKLEVGTTLPDANVHVKMNMGGAMNMNMNVETINRKVEKTESVTTPYNTFENCFVIYSETKTKMMLNNRTFPNRTWFAEGVGMVKQESYDKKGKLMGSMVLTALND